jgi:nitrite reductase/ring-hydroxylating ferredoxin subunit
MDADGWIATIPLEDLAEGRSAKATAGEDRLLLRRIGEQVYALENRCTHQGAPLDRGPVAAMGSDPAVTCPFHGSVFRLEDGRVLRGPASAPVRAFQTRVRDGVIEVRQRAEEP